MPDHGTTRGEHLNDPSKSRYWNDVSLNSWLRNGDATSKPSFDHSKNAPRFNKSDGNDWGTADKQDTARRDTGTNRKPEPNTPGRRGR